MTVNQKSAGQSDQATRHCERRRMLPMRRGLHVFPSDYPVKVGGDQMSVVNRQFDGFEEIEAAEEAVDVAAAAVDAARGRLCAAAETFVQAQNNLVKVQQEHGIPVPDWPEHSMVGRRWWATEVLDERPGRIT